MKFSWLRDYGCGYSPLFFCALDTVCSSTGVLSRRCLNFHIGDIKHTDIHCRSVRPSLTPSNYVDSSDLASISLIALISPLSPKAYITRSRRAQLEALIFLFEVFSIKLNIIQLDGWGYTISFILPYSSTPYYFGESRADPAMIRNPSAMEIWISQRSSTTID